MIQMMEKIINPREIQKVICNDHGEKIIFRQENINLLGCHLCQYGV
jgi:hypothetical protein